LSCSVCRHIKINVSKPSKCLCVHRRHRDTEGIWGLLTGTRHGRCIHCCNVAELPTRQLLLLQRRKSRSWLQTIPRRRQTVEEIPRARQRERPAGSYSREICRNRSHPCGTKRHR
jgi:hypothetical protein